MVLGVNIGKTKVVPEDQAAADHEKSTRLLAPYADYLVVNVSSPNTPGLRDLQAVDKLRAAAGRGAARRRRRDRAAGRRVPLLVKIAPDLADDDVLAVADLAVAEGLDGIVATNTTIGREGLTTPAADVERAGAGGLSGAPLTARAEAVTRLLRDRVGPDLTLIGVGGIATPEDAVRRVRAGATLVQAYTGFVYGGPTWPARVQRALALETGDGRTGQLMDPFGTRLQAAMAAHGPVCAGVDPHASLLAAWGLDDDAEGVRRFSQACVEAWAGEVALVKPQSAFYERHGSRGIAALEEMVAAFREAGTLVLLDVKRGDIGSTAQAYAEAYLDPAAPLAVDAITASPYLGIGSLDPMVDLARAHGAGLFVLALTSNPEAPQVQLARTTVGPTAGSTVAETVLAALAELNRRTQATARLPGRPGRRATGAAPGLGSFGAVVGATVTPSPELTAALDFGGPVSCPGSAPRAAPSRRCARWPATPGSGCCPSISRELLGAGPDPRALRDAARALERAVRDGAPWLSPS